MSLFNRRNRRATIFASVPWFIQDLGTYGIGIFTPTILAAALGGGSDHIRSVSDLIADGILAAKGAAMINVLLIVGIFFAVMLADWAGRIKLQILGFIGCAVGLLLASFVAAFGVNLARTLLLTQPHNPWGRVFTPAELEGIRDVVTRRRARVVSDEIHAPLVLPGAVHTSYLDVEGTHDHAELTCDMGDLSGASPDMLASFARNATGIQRILVQNLGTQYGTPYLRLYSDDQTCVSYKLEGGALESA